MAQPGSPSRGFGGRILSVVEATPGTTPTDPALIKFSDYVQSVSLSLDPQLQKYRDIGDYDVATFVAGLPVYGLKVVYLLHVNRKTQVDDAAIRQADNSLKSQTIEVAVNLDGATPGFFVFKGAQADDVQVKEEVGKPTMVEVTYKALACTRQASTSPITLGSGSRETAALGSLSVGSASSITRGGSAVGYITRAAEFRVSNALQVIGTDNQTDPKAIFAGGREVTGKMDITIDDGGVAIADAALALTGATVVFNLGAASAPKYTLYNCVWENLELPMGVQEGVIIQGVPFTARKDASNPAIAAGTV
jgi:hypothetical protein